MKKIILCFVLGIMSLLYSCNNNIEVDLAYQVNVEVEPKDVLASFIPYIDDDFYMLEGDVVRINLFVYDEVGALVNNQSKKLKDYYEKANFSLKLPVGNYTIVATSDIYTTTYNFEAWTYSDIDNINDFTITQKYRFGPDALLGLKLIKTEISEPTNIEMPLTSATALINWKMYHIHDDNLIYEDVLYFDEYHIALNGKFNETLVIEDDEFKALPAPNGYFYYIASLSPKDIKSENIYHYSAILPVEKTSVTITVDLVDLKTGESELVEYPFIEPVIATFKAGKQYVVDVDLRDRTLEVYNNGLNRQNLEMNVSANNCNKVEGVRLMDVIDYNPELKLSKLSR